MTVQLEMKRDKRAEAREIALAAANKQFGKNSIYVYGKAKVEPVPVIKTGSMFLDEALGIGGLPQGRIIEIYGPESSGKTTLALHVVAECQKAGGTAVFIDAEHALDPAYAQALGVDMDELLLAQPMTGEECLGLAHHMVKSSTVDLIVIDSVAALVPKAELEGEIGDSHVGRQARLMSQALRMITGAAEQTNTTVLFINQIRMKIGVMFGNPETQPGGNALKFYSSVRIDIRRSTPIKAGTEVIGNNVRIKVVKNKMAPPFRVAETVIMYGEGLDVIREVGTRAIEYEIINKRGAWLSFNTPEGEQRCQGSDQLRAFFASNPEQFEYIRAAVLLEAARRKATNETASKS